MMMVKEQRDIKPLLLKFGVALAISFAGFLYSRLRTKRIKPSPPPPSPPSLDHGSEVNLKGGKAWHKDDLLSVKTTSISSNTDSVAAEYDETFIPKVCVNSIAGFSPSSKSSGDKEELLLPEFNDFVNELDFAAAKAGFSPRTDVETPRSNIDTSKAFRSAENDEYKMQPTAQILASSDLLRQKPPSCNVLRRKKSDKKAAEELAKYKTSWKYKMRRIWIGPDQMEAEIASGKYRFSSDGGTSGQVLNLITQFAVFQGVIYVALKSCGVAFTLDYNDPATAAKDVIKTVMRVDTSEAYDKIDDMDSTITKTPM